MSSRTTDKDTRRAQIVAAAATVFARDGYRTTRVADIAVEAGVGKGTVYEYFDSKEELFLAVYEALQHHIDGRIRAVLEQDLGALERLDALLAESAAVVAETREMHGVTLAFWSASIGSAVENRFEAASVELYRHYRSMVADLLRAGQSAGEVRSDIDPQAVAVMLVAAIDGLGIQHWFEPEVDPRMVVHRFASTLKAGLQGGSR